MKYSQLSTTRSQLLRRAWLELRSHGLRHVARVSFHSISTRIHRRLVAAGRYARWASLSVTPVGTFRFQGSEYRYFRHPYNATWQNERAVEVPIVRRAIDDAGDARVLEVGNVLGNYAGHDHDVVDKYEPGANILNFDILEFRAKQPYDLIVSISTLEHVGWDDGESDPRKIPRAVGHLRSLLAPGGRAIVTLPLGYNRYLDELLRAGESGFDREHCLLRIARTRWCEVTRAGLGRPIYGKPFPGANGLVIGIIERTA